ncbi:MAG: hypothetical protein IJN36_06235 [Clostridia bacterium]|nr:hypothetical protein [Clostridia bacterium]MBR2886538.1 hypothetical protein [Clostridia bacterium]
MRIEPFSKIIGGRQDGAFYNGYFFSLNNQGLCTVYKMETLENQKEGAEIFDEFVMDKNDILSPHSNAVMFGNEFYEKEDEFPLLYTNIYNNYASADNPLKGVCLAYRVQKTDAGFKTTLVQMIEIDFVEDEKLWKSEGQEDARPYGNFTIDAENGIYYAFTMRDKEEATRFFSFDLPKADRGEICEKYNVKKVVLYANDIREYFDCGYQHFIQGACCHKGKIYSLEGFTNSVDNPAAIRIIDTKLKKEVCFKKFKDFGTDVEPEMIDFENDTCYYTDHHGNMYKLFF